MQDGSNRERGKQNIATFRRLQTFLGLMTETLLWSSPQDKGTNVIEWWGWVEEPGKSTVQETEKDLDFQQKRRGIMFPLFVCMPSQNDILKFPATFYFVKYQGTLCFFCWRPDGWRISCLLSAHPHRIGPCILCVSLFTLAVGYSPGQNSLLPSGRTYPGTHVSWSLACKSNQFLKLGPWRWGQELLPESVVPSYSVSAKHNSILHLFRICEIINSFYCIIHKMNREEFFWMFSLKGGSRASLSTWIS